MAGNWNYVIFKVTSNPSHTMIQCFYDSDILWNNQRNNPHPNVAYEKLFFDGIGFFCYFLFEFFWGVGLFWFSL